MRAAGDGCSASVAGGTRDADDTRRPHSKESCALACERTQRRRGARRGAARAAEARRDHVFAQGSVEAGDGSLEGKCCVGGSETVTGGDEAHRAARLAGRDTTRRRFVLLFGVRFRRAVALGKLAARRLVLQLARAPRPPQALRAAWGRGGGQIARQMACEVVRMRTNRCAITQREIGELAR